MSDAYANFFRLGRLIERPSQLDVLHGSCGYSTELGWNEELYTAHFGEDGPGYHMIRTREFSIEGQSMFFTGQMQEWADDEHLQFLMMAEDHSLNSQEI